MPKTTKYLYCDSCVFLAYFNKEAGRVETLDQLFEEVEKDGDRRLITSAFSIIEVAHVASEKQYLKLDPTLEQKLDAFWANSSLLEIIDIHEHLARKARSIMRQALQLTYSLKGADALHLASAQSVGVDEFFTYDDLGKYASLVGITICEPYITQPRLPMT